MTAAEAGAPPLPFEVTEGWDGQLVIANGTDNSGDTTDEELISANALPNARVMRLFSLLLSVLAINPLSTVSPARLHRGSLPGSFFGGGEPTPTFLADLAPGKLRPRTWCFRELGAGTDRRVHVVRMLPSLRSACVGDGGITDGQTWWTGHVVLERPRHCFGAGGRRTVCMPRW